MSPRLHVRFFITHLAFTAARAACRVAVRLNPKIPEVRIWIGGEEPRTGMGYSCGHGRRSR